MAKKAQEFDKRVVTPKINVFNMKTRPLPAFPAPITKVNSLVAEVKEYAPLLKQQEYMEISNCSSYAKYLLAKQCRQFKLNYAYDKKRRIMYIVNGEF